MQWFFFWWVWWLFVYCVYYTMFPRSLARNITLIPTYYIIPLGWNTVFCFRMRMITFYKIWILKHISAHFKLGLLLLFVLIFLISLLTWPIANTHKIYGLKCWLSLNNDGRCRSGCLVVLCLKAIWFQVQSQCL